MKRFAAIALATMISSSAFAAECFQSEDNPAWTITKTGDAFRWKQGSQTVMAYDGTGGTGVPYRALYFGKGKASRYIIHKGDMIIEMMVYKAGCK